MKKNILIVVLVQLIFLQANAQIVPTYKPRIESCPCLVKIDSALKTKCGYLIVPENRNKPAGKTIKLPFVYVLSPNPAKKKDPVFFTTGGPGYSSISNLEGMTAKSGRIKDRDYLAMDQRGTSNAKPCLKCDEVEEAIKRSYREQLPKDSLVQQAVKQCRKKLTAQGIDLSAYNTVESAADIEDLRLALEIDSMNLVGISYSGGLMLTVLRNFPNGVRSLVLGSPLPGFVNYEEDGLFNFNESLKQVFQKAAKDSADKMLYGNLEQRFQQYFLSIGSKTFILPYVEKGSTSTLQVKYTRDDLLNVIIDKLADRGSVSEVAYVITELVKGNHEIYIRQQLDNIFTGDKRLSLGMRYSVYCTEQIAYSNEKLVKKQEEIFPYLANFHFNNVDHAICECWKVEPGPKDAKSPVYSNVPALLISGDLDPYCRPFYNDLVQRYMPNSQTVVVVNGTHVPGTAKDGVELITLFLDAPFTKLEAGKGTSFIIK